MMHYEIKCCVWCCSKSFACFWVTFDYYAI